MSVVFLNNMRVVENINFESSEENFYVIKQSIRKVYYILEV